MKKLLFLSMALLAASSTINATSFRPTWYSDNNQVDGELQRCQLESESMFGTSKTAKDKEQCINAVKAKYPNEVQYGVQNYYDPMLPSFPGARF